MNPSLTISMVVALVVAACGSSSRRGGGDGGPDGGPDGCATSNYGGAYAAVDCNGNTDSCTIGDTTTGNFTLSCTTFGGTSCTGTVTGSSFSCSLTIAGMTIVCSGQFVGCPGTQQTMSCRSGTSTCAATLTPGP